MAKKPAAPREADFDELVQAGYRWRAPLPQSGLEEQDQSDEPQKSGFARRALVDPALSLWRGTMALPTAAVGLASMATGGRAGKLAEELGFRPGEAGQIIEGMLTPEQQAANREVQQATGFGEALGAAIANPSTILHAGIESVPGMLGGGAVGAKLLQSAPRLMKMGGAGRAIAAGAGEGVIMAGSQAEEIRRQTADGLLTPTQSMLAGATGLGGGAISALSGGLAARYGDVDQLLMRPVPQAVASGKGGAPLGLMARMTGGAVTEGGEELAQSVLEQTLQNKALGRPIDQGVGNAAAMGLLAGGLMGGAAGAIRGGDPIREMKLPEAGPLSKSVNAGLEREATQADAPAVKQLLARAEGIIDRAARASESAASPQAIDEAMRAAGAAKRAKDVLLSGEEWAVSSASGWLADAIASLRAIPGVEWRTEPGATGPVPDGAIAFEPQAIIDTSGLELASPESYAAAPKVARPPREELQRAVWAARSLGLQPTDQEIEAGTARVNGAEAEVITPAEMAFGQRAQDAQALPAPPGHYPRRLIGMSQGKTGRIVVTPDGLAVPETEIDRINAAQRANARQDGMVEQAPQKSPRQESQGTRYLNPNTAKKPHGGAGLDARRAPRAKTSESNVIIDPVAAYVREREAEGTHAGKAFAHEFRVGRITREQVQELMTRRPPTADEQIAAAAASAKPEVDTTQRRIEAAAKQGAQQQTYGGGIILADNGKPFGSKVVAERRARIIGGGAVVEPAQGGGFVVAQPKIEPENVEQTGGALQAEAQASELASQTTLEGGSGSGNATGDSGVAKTQAGGATSPQAAAPATAAPPVVQNPSEPTAAKAAEPQKPTDLDSIQEERIRRGDEVVAAEVGITQAQVDDFYSGGNATGINPSGFGQDGLSLEIQRRRMAGVQPAPATPEATPEPASVTAERPNQQAQSAAASDAEAWGAMPKNEREAVISKAGWAAPLGGLKPQAREWVGRQWGDIGTKARVKLATAMREHLQAKRKQGPEAAAPAAATQPAPQAQQPATPAATGTPKQLELSKRIAVVEKLIACLKS